MQRKLALLLLSFVVGVGMFGFSQDNAKPDKDKCLACHGPYEKIQKATADFKTSSGETVTPHQYVPHEEKKDIPDCTNCHTAHPIPPPDKASIVKPTGIDWCYTGCHHANNLQPCKNCH
jgi:hypothetical protein